MSTNKFIYLEGLHAETSMDYLYFLSLITLNYSKKNEQILLILNSKKSRNSLLISNYFRNILPTIKVLYIRDNFTKPSILFFSVIRTLNLLFKWKDLLGYSVDDILIGDLLYDSLLISHREIKTIKGLRIPYLKNILLGFLEYYSYKKIVSKYSPKKLYSSHLVYTSFGLLSRLAHKAGSKIYLTSQFSIKEIKADTNILYQTQAYNPYNTLSLIDDKLKIQTANDFYLQRINGSQNQFDAQMSFNNKKIFTHHELDTMLNFKNKKKIILVASHVLVDAPHNGALHLFRDYLDWLIFTLNLLQNNDNINVIVKEHPSSQHYGEKDYVKRLINSNYYSSNVKFLPDYVNTKSLLDYVDVTLTCSGTIGIEFACNGIPAVTVGQTYYEGHGFSLKPKSIIDYVEILDKIHELTKLNKVQTNMAKLLFYQDNKIITPIKKRYSNLEINLVSERPSSETLNQILSDVKKFYNESMFEKERIDEFYL
jgi:hypothetical protein